MIRTIAESSCDATAAFRTFESGKPDLIQTGIRPVDNRIGGLFAGSAGILAAFTGVGKSSTMLLAAFEAAKQYPVGIVSLEDTPDLVGARALSLVSGVDSLRIRIKDLSPPEIARIKQAQDYLAGVPVAISYCIGARVDKIAAEIQDLASRGCRMIYIDYIQKIRGGTSDRRNEVSAAFSELQGACHNAGCAAMFISQFKRPQDPVPGKPPPIPQISWLKESGDLENEARLIILMYRDDMGIIHARIAKSSFGGEGVSFLMKRDSSGSLREIE